MDEEPRDGSGVASGRSADTVVPVLYAIALFIALAWLWVMVRQQQNISDFPQSFDGEAANASLVDRIDITFQSVVLLAYAALVGGIAQIVALLSRRDPTR